MTEIICPHNGKETPFEDCVECGRPCRHTFDEPELKGTCRSCAVKRMKTVTCPDCGKDREISYYWYWKKGGSRCNACQCLVTSRTRKPPVPRGTAVASIRKTRDMHRPESDEKPIPAILTCLKCDKPFKSPDKKRIRLCKSCRSINQNECRGVMEHCFAGYNRGH